MVENCMSMPPKYIERTMGEREYAAIKAVCEKYGYGNVMTMASALWMNDMEKKGFPISGCFVPVCPYTVKDDMRHFEDTVALYRSIVRYFEAREENGIQ